jgi:DNA-directed RNA polymerase I subunit RPA49
MVVSPSRSNVDFVGTNYSGEATIGQRYKYALGVFDKESQSLKIVPVACDRVSLLFGC